jgi:DNA-binding transcriptional MerR regulator
MTLDHLADLLAEIGGTPRPVLSRPTGEIGIKQATHLLGVSARTLRFYEEDGLLSAGRTIGAHRYYNAEQMTRAFVIIALRRLGMAVDAIRPLMGPESLASADVATVLRAHVTVLEDDLAAARARLETTLRALERMDGGNVTSLAGRRQAAE